MEGNITIICLCVVFVASARSAFIPAPAIGDTSDISVPPKASKHLHALEIGEGHSLEQLDKNSNESEKSMYEDRSGFDVPNCPHGMVKYFGVCCPIVDKLARCDLVEPKEK